VPGAKGENLDAESIMLNALRSQAGAPIDAAARCITHRHIIIAIYIIVKLLVGKPITITYAMNQNSQTIGIVMFIAASIVIWD